MTLKKQVTLDRDGRTSLDWDSYPTLRFSEVSEIEARSCVTRIGRRRAWVNARSAPPRPAWPTPLPIH